MEGSGERKLIFKPLGLTSYKDVWKIQTVLFDSILSAKQKGNNNHDNYLITCEHNHVITLGKSGKESNITIHEFPGVEYVRIDRGGDITYHGPGQLVVYPILDLEQFGMGLKTYIFLIEQAVIDTLKSFDIESGRIKEYTGVWVDYQSATSRKIAAVGVRSSRYVTMHGLAFNIKPDLTYFNLIVPCGIIDKEVTSIEKELGKEVDFEKVSEVFRLNLLRLLG